MGSLPVVPPADQGAAPPPGCRARSSRFNGFPLPGEGVMLIALLLFGMGLIATVLCILEI